MSSLNNNNYKRIMMVGETGAGKSHLGNLVLRRVQFVASASAASETKHVSSANIDADRITVMDTIGLNDSAESQIVVRGRILDGLKAAVHGIDVFLLIFRVGRYTQPLHDSYKYLFQAILGTAAFKNCVLVITHCDPDLQSNFEGSQAKWLEDSKRNNPSFAKMFDSVSGRVVFVNNPPKTGNVRQEEMNVESREESRQELVRVIQQLSATRYEFVQAKAAADEYDHKRAEIAAKEKLERDKAIQDQVTVGVNAATAALNDRLKVLQAQYEENEKKFKEQLEKVIAEREAALAEARRAKAACGGRRRSRKICTIS